MNRNKHLQSELVFVPVGWLHSFFSAVNKQGNQSVDNAHFFCLLCECINHHHSIYSQNIAYSYYDWALCNNPMQARL